MIWAPVAILALVVGIAVLIYVFVQRAQGGATAAGGPAGVLQTSDFHALAFSSASPNVVFFGHHNGVLRSDDGGRTWRGLVERRNFDAMGLAVSRADQQRVYLAGHDVFQVSTDGGASWQPVANNLPGTDIHGFAMSPDDPNRLYALAVPYGLFVSADAGQTWQRPEGQLPGDVMTLAAAGGSPETLFAGSMRAGLLRSADGGQTWSPVANGQGPRGVMAVAVDPIARGMVYSGAQGGLYKSTDSGASWSKLPFPGDNVVALAGSPAQPNLLLAITVKDRQGLVYRSEDGGQSWGQGQ